MNMRERDYEWVNMEEGKHWQVKKKGLEKEGQLFNKHKACILVWPY